MLMRTSDIDRMVGAFAAKDLRPIEVKRLNLFAGAAGNGVDVGWRGTPSYFLTYIGRVPALLRWGPCIELHSMR
jgi:hypothetical protein